MVTSTKRSHASNRGNPAAKKSATGIPAPPSDGDGVPPSNLDILRRMYAAMLKCRMMEERAQNAGTAAYDLAIGHEAVVVGSSIELQSEDVMAASHRNFAAHVVMGTPLKYLLKHTGATDSDGSSASIISCQRTQSVRLLTAVFPADPFNLGTGLALSHKLEMKGAVVLAVWDKDASSLDASHEALKFAGRHKLPIIYITSNGGLGDLGGRKRSALEEFSFMAKDYRFPSILVDGKDVVAVWRAAQESIHRARIGSGPTLIECQAEQAGFDDPLGHMQHYMTRRGVWDDRWRGQVAGQISAEIEGAMRLPES